MDGRITRTVAYSMRNCAYRLELRAVAYSIGNCAYKLVTKGCCILNGELYV